MRAALPQSPLAPRAVSPRSPQHAPRASLEGAPCHTHRSAAPPAGSSRWPECPVPRPTDARPRCQATHPSRSGHGEKSVCPDARGQWAPPARSSWTVTSAGGSNRGRAGPSPAKVLTTGSGVALTACREAGLCITGRWRRGEASCGAPGHGGPRRMRKHTSGRGHPLQGLQPGPGGPAPPMSGGPGGTGGCSDAQPRGWGQPGQEAGGRAEEEAGSISTRGRDRRPSRR